MIFSWGGIVNAYPIPAKEQGEVCYETETPYGTLVSKVTVEGDKVKMYVTVPIGTRASVYVPKSFEAAVLNPLDDSSYELHEVGPGIYSF